MNEKTMDEINNHRTVTLKQLQKLYNKMLAKNGIDKANPFTNRRIIKTC